MEALPSPKLSHMEGILSPTAASRRAAQNSSNDEFQEINSPDRQTFSIKSNAYPMRHSPFASVFHSSSFHRSPSTPYGSGSSPNQMSTIQSMNSTLLSGPVIITYDSHKTTESQASLQLLNAIIGAGIVGYPFCFRSAGVLLGTLLVLCTMIFSEFSMQLLLLLSHLTGKRSYEDIARDSFGSIGQTVVDACIATINVGSLVAYLNLVADTFSLVSGTIVPPGAEPSRTAILSGITVCIAFPLALFVKSPRVLSAVSQASIAFLVLFVGLLLTLGFNSTTSSALLTLEWWKWSGLVTSFPVVMFSFTAQQVLFAVYRSLHTPSVPKMSNVVMKTVSSAALTYILVGWAGYKAFGARTHGDVLRNIPSRGIGQIVKVGYGLSLLATIPLLILPLQRTFAPMVSMITMKKEVREGLVVAGCLTTACITAILIPNVEYVFGLAGSTSSVLIAFILPAALFLHVSGAQKGQQGHSIDLTRGSPRWKRKRQTAALLLVFGVVSGVVCTLSLLGSIQEEAQVAQLAQKIVEEEKKAAVAVATKYEAANVFKAAGAVGVARYKLNATQEDINRALGVVERASIALDGHKDSDDKIIRKAAAKDLKPALKVAQDAVEDLENAWNALKTALGTYAGLQKSQDLQGLFTATLEAAQASRLALQQAQLILRAGTDGNNTKTKKNRKNSEESGELLLKKALSSAQEAALKVNETMKALMVAKKQQEEYFSDLNRKLGDDLNKEIAFPEEKKSGVEPHDQTEQQMTIMALVAETAAKSAEDVVQTAKEAAEQAVGKATKVDVAVRAIAIAKELASSSLSNNNGNNSSETVHFENNGIQGEEVRSQMDGDDDENAKNLLLGNLTAVAVESQQKLVVKEVDRGRSDGQYDLNRGDLDVRQAKNESVQGDDSDGGKKA